MKTLILFILLILCPLVVQAQSDACADGQSLVIDTVNKRYKCITISTGGLGAGGNINMTVANASSTGTTVNKLAKLTGAPSTAVIAATSDTENAVGIVVSGAGTTGSATIAIMGQASCVFDGATTAGNYFTISSTVAGDCHDAGSSFPTSGATYGRVLSTNGSVGTYTVELMTPDVAFQNGGNGKSRPGGSNLDYQYNNSNQFGGGRLKQESTNVVSINGGVTNQAFEVYDSDNGSGTYNRLRLQRVSGSWRYVSETNSGASGGDIQFFLGTGASAFLSYDGANFFPGTASSVNLGKSTNPWAEIDGQNIQLFSATNGVRFVSPDTELISVAAGRLQIRGFNNNGAGTGLLIGDVNTNGFILKKGTSGIPEMREGDDSAYKSFRALSYQTGTNTIYGAGTPSISGNATLNSGSKDSAGKITSTGTGASTVVLTFSAAFANAPACMVTNETTSNLVRPVSTTTTLTIAATIVTGDSLSYTCLGY